jgi:hypothetical protein
MKCTIVQTERLKEAQKAEIAVYDFLKNLPEGLYVCRELKLTNRWKQRVKGFVKLKPDYVVLGAEIGAVSIEVKDWNITTNRYDWLDQYKVKVHRADGSRSNLHNPQDQADVYREALMELLQGSNLFVSSLLAFPFIQRQEFLNKFRGLTVQGNPQAKFFLDMNYILFKDDLDRSAHDPQGILVGMVKQQKKFHKSSEAEVEEATSKLVPETFVVGGLHQNKNHKAKMKFLDKEQQAWVFDQSMENNYLLDAPGSGKTNVLISKALFLLSKSKHGARPKILLTTYSTNLENNIHDLFEDKVRMSPEHATDIRKSLTILGMPKLIESIVKAELPEALKPEAGESTSAIEDRVKELAGLILEDDEEGKREIFDYIFIDEVQDFDDEHLFILSKLSKGKQYFFVGDIGQKIYNRSHNLQRHGIITKPLRIHGSFRMYRTPCYIADLAVKFVKFDVLVRNEFETNGYLDNFQYPNALQNAAILKKSSNPINDMCKQITDFLDSGRSAGEILWIGDEITIEHMSEALKERHVPCEMEYIRNDVSGSVVLTSFSNAKGLERELVLISDIELLFHEQHPDAFLLSGEDIAFKQSQSRRLIYVALTRCIEELYLFYLDSKNPFISDLLEIDRKLLYKREQRDIRNG